MPEKLNYTPGLAEYCADFADPKFLEQVSPAVEYSRNDGIALHHKQAIGYVESLAQSLYEDDRMT